MKMTGQAVNADSASSPWRWLYKMGGAAALFAVVLIPVQIIIFTSVPVPDTAAGWFTLFQDNKLLGLLSFEVLFVINAAVGIATTLALYVVLRRVNESFMAIALVFSLLGAVAIIMARPALDMLYLSDQYAAATTETQRTLFLAAGETLLSMRNGTAFHLSYNLANVYLIIVPLVMLQSTIFSKITAYMGILAGVIGFGLYVPTIGIFLSVISVLFMAVWNILIARKLFQLSQ